MTLHLGDRLFREDCLPAVRINSSEDIVQVTVDGQIDYEATIRGLVADLRAAFGGILAALDDHPANFAILDGEHTGSFTDCVVFTRRVDVDIALEDDRIEVDRSVKIGAGDFEPIEYVCHSLDLQWGFPIGFHAFEANIGATLQSKGGRIGDLSARYPPNSCVNDESENGIRPLENNPARLIDSPMAQTMTCDAELLQNELRDYLERCNRTGDTERIAQELPRKHSVGYQVVGFRRRGNEVLLCEQRSSLSGNELTIHEVTVDGRLPKIGTLWTGRDLEDWLAHHQFYLEWVHPDLEIDV